MDETEEITIKLPKRHIEFIDSFLNGPACPWKTRGDFLRECYDFYLDVVFKRVEFLAEKYGMNREPN